MEANSEFKKSKEVLLIFRRFKPGRFSIEKVFEPLHPFTKKVCLPYELTSISNLIRIFIFILSIRQKYIHVTGDVHYITFLLFWKKSVLTIHDLNNYEKLNGLKKIIYGVVWFWLPIRTANIIVVISPETKNRLIKYFKVKKSKIRIISNSFNRYSYKATSSPSEMFNILAVGTKDNKNLPRLFEAVRHMKNIKLTIIGKLNQEYMELLDVNDVVYANKFNISDDQLAAQYASADLLYFASLKEGFGLPILEAQSAEVPVITSNISSMPFVAGNAAIFVNPHSTTEIRDSILSVKNNSKVRKELIKRGILNIERFSQSRFVVSYLSTYNSL